MSRRTKHRRVAAVSPATIEELAVLTGLTVEQVAEAEQHLAEHGYIRRTGTRAVEITMPPTKPAPPALVKVPRGKPR